jgi:predicted RNA-binding Zn-ribbon protein involved in translation (DUF1610 family)
MRSRLNMMRKTGGYSSDSCPTCGSGGLIKIDEYDYPTGWLEVFECPGCGSIIEKIIE